MKINGIPYQTIWLEEGATALSSTLYILDQTQIPHQPLSALILPLKTFEEVVLAIREMKVRGAGLIGVTGAYGMYLAAQESFSFSDSLGFLRECAQRLIATRPTAINLAWAVQIQLEVLSELKDYEERVERAKHIAQTLEQWDKEACYRIGKQGLKLLKAKALENPHRPLEILTHCNAGWLAFVDYGSATSPIYQAFEEGIPLHVWVDETRPRCQGSLLTAWELRQQGVPHTVIVDNVGGYLMQQKKVDMVLTGADRVTLTGDVANKIGTYLKALAAFDNQIPFYVAFPSSTLDWSIRDGVKDIPIETRSPTEVEFLQGLLPDGTLASIRLFPEESPSLNYGFDVTPARLVTACITEEGIARPDEISMLELHPEPSLRKWKNTFFSLPKSNNNF
jgi:methylthioribose-1-phosphate isomerase